MIIIRYEEKKQNNVISLVTLMITVFIAIMTMMVELKALPLATAYLILIVFYTAESFIFNNIALVHTAYYKLKLICIEEIEQEQKRKVKPHKVKQIK